MLIKILFIINFAFSSDQILINFFQLFAGYYVSMDQEKIFYKLFWCCF